MNTKNRVLSLLLALVMVFGAVVPSLAENHLPDTTDKTEAPVVKEVNFEVRNQLNSAVIKELDDGTFKSVKILYKSNDATREDDITQYVKVARLTETPEEVYRKYQLTYQQTLTNPQGSIDHFRDGKYTIVVKEIKLGREFTTHFYVEGGTLKFENAEGKLVEVTKDNDIVLDMVEFTERGRIYVKGNDFKPVQGAKVELYRPLLDNGKVVIKNNEYQVDGNQINGYLTTNVDGFADFDYAIDPVTGYIVFDGPYTFRHGELLVAKVIVTDANGNTVEQTQLVNLWTVKEEYKGNLTTKEVLTNPAKYLQAKEDYETTFLFVEDESINIRVRIETHSGKPVPNAKVEVGLPKSTTRYDDFAFGDVVASGKTDAQGYVDFTVDKIKKIDKVDIHNGFFIPESIAVPYLVRQVDNGNNEGVIKSDELYTIVGDGEYDAPNRVWELLIKNREDLAKDRVGGENRYETAVRVADKIYPNGLQVFEGYTNIVIAAGDNYADALTASTTAYNYNAPLLLTKKAALAGETLAYVKTHLVEVNARNPRIIIVGGPNTVAPSVADEIRALGVEVKRISGADRYETSVVNAKDLLRLAIANNDAPLMKGFTGSEAKVVLASGENFPDALAVASPAAHAGYPLLLTKKDMVPEVVKNFIVDNKAKRVDIIGGTSSVSEKVVHELDTLMGLTVARVADTDRSKTSLVIAGKYYPNATHVYISSGVNFADALTGSTLAAKEGSPVILLPNAKTITDEIKAYIKASKITNFTILGGVNTVSVEARNELSELILNK